MSETIIFGRDKLLAGVDILNGRTAAVQRDLNRIMRAKGAPIRPMAERLIEHLIRMLDDLDADPDLEDNGDGEPDADGEPSLGSFDRALNQLRWSSRGGTSEWDVDLERDVSDDEPALGSLGSAGWDAESSNQERWATGCRHDMEHEDEGPDFHPAA